MEQSTNSELRIGAKVRVLTDENWLVEKGQVRKIKEINTDREGKIRHIVVDHGFYPTCSPVLFPGEYEVVEICEVCEFLRGLGVEENLITKLHNSEIALTDLPDYAQAELLKRWKEHSEE